MLRLVEKSLNRASFCICLIVMVQPLTSPSGGGEVRGHCEQLDKDGNDLIPSGLGKATVWTGRQRAP